MAGGGGFGAGLSLFFAAVPAQLPPLAFTCSGRRLALRHPTCCMQLAIKKPVNLAIHRLISGFYLTHYLQFEHFLLPLLVLLIAVPRRVGACGSGTGYLRIGLRSK